ncbi:tRNA lysidine(34) synthetase TilS [Oceaniglobus indicus]|uniref:tRNA lysidine(34) synthetase TilS n=1 Tax=Oceaniglobus indicus TaxID=2047749 RepID=UPI000C180182|nr:tRNA lysidine(34) synthetase TilS [Oceaniglobus indicus]
MIPGAVTAALDDIFQHEPPRRMGLAVSGGGDSIALMHAAVPWATAAGVSLHVVTVDHGLRPESAHEAVMVAAQARALHLSHDTLRWHDWDGSGNLQAAARDARRRLIAEWAVPRRIHHVATGHTLDDQAETVLLRLARGSGVDGLAGIAATTAGAPNWLRPLLGLRRDALRDWLHGQGIGWADDPSNDDPRFDRVRARAMLGGLSDLGLTPERLARLAAHMGDARAVLRAQAQMLATRIVTRDGPDLVIDDDGFDAAPPDTRNRLLAAAVMWISSADYRPRYDALSRYMRRSVADTLSGCLMRQERGCFRLTREYNAVKDLRGATDAPWDRRWHLDGPHDPALHVAALGPHGLQQCGDWRDTGLPRASLLATPAIWRGEALIAAPLAGMTNGWAAKLAKGRDDFAAFLLSH